jgi:hypothetical protein
MPSDVPSDVPSDDAGLVRRQATVLTYDSSAGAGRVLLDDGVALALPPGSLAPGPVRRLRRGQRVVVLIDERQVPPVVRLAHLVTVPPEPGQT